MGMTSMTGDRYAGFQPRPASEYPLEWCHPQGPRMPWATMDWKAQAALPSTSRECLHPPSQDPQIKRKAVNSTHQQLSSNTHGQTLDMVTGAQIKRKAVNSSNQQLPRNTNGQTLDMATDAQSISEILLTSDNRPDGNKHLQELWQSHDLPQELRLVQAGTPQEIRTIIKDSMNHFQAVRDSLREPVIHSNLLSEPSLTILTSSVKERILSTTENPYVPHKRLDSLESAPALDSPSTASHSSTAQQPNNSATTMGCNADLSVEQPNNQPPTSLLYTNLAPIAPLKLAKDKSRPMRNRLTKIFRKTDVKGKKTDPYEPVPTIPAIQYNECASCFDDVSSVDTISLACQHHYCSLCFSQLVATAILNESLFPPKCCLQEIPRKTLKANITAAEFAKYNLKAQEFSISAGERWFCPSADCGKWFDRSKTCSRGDTVSCPHCKTYMCQHCRGLTHARGARCPRDQALDATLETAELNGWRRCYNCHAMVELASGCRHITCKCKAEFWYVSPLKVRNQVNLNSYTCCAKWKTCHCTENDEVRRRLNLGERRKALEKDDAEVMAAIAAVAEAERREMDRREREEQSVREASEELEKRRIKEVEARIAEEERMIERMENSRVQAIAKHYDDLRQAMARLHKLQYKAISKRHSMEEDLSQRLADIQSREAAIQGQILREIPKMRREIEKTIQEIQLVFTRQILDIAARHRKESEKQSEVLALLNDGQPNSETTKVSSMWELEYMQQAELNALRTQLDNDMGKLQRRAAAPQLPETLLESHAALQREKSDIHMAKLEITRRHCAEVKWMDTVIVERGSMLFEDEQRLVDSGAEVRGIPSISSGLRQRPRLSSLFA